MRTSFPTLSLVIFGTAAFALSLSSDAVAENDGASAASSAAASGMAADFPHTGVLIIFVNLLIFAFIIVAAFRLKTKEWTLAGALSDPITLTSEKTAPPGAAAGTAPTQEQQIQMTPSTSRYVAFIGMIVLLAMFDGFGSIMLWRYGQGEKIADSDAILKFLLGGAALFVPYGFNQMQKAVSSLGAK